MPFHHDPDSVMSLCLGCDADQADLYRPFSWLTLQDEEVHASLNRFQSMRFGSSRTVRAARMSFYPLGFHFIHASPVYSASGTSFPNNVEDAYAIEESRLRLEYLKSITKDEKPRDTRAQKEKRYRKLERRNAHKARDLACKSQQRRARKQAPKGR